MDREKYKNLEDYIISLEESEKQLRFLLDLSDKLRTLSDPRDIHQLITSEARRYFKADRCYYGEVDGDRVIISQDSSEDNLETIAGKYIMRRFVKYNATIRSGYPIVEENVYFNEDMDSSLKEELLSKNIISFIWAPVMKKNNLKGIFVISHSKASKWKDTEVKLAIDIAERTWMAVERSKGNQEKEKLISQLIEERAKLQAILDNVDAAVWYTDRLGRTRLIGGRDKGDFSDKIHDLSSKDLYKNLLYSNMDGSQLLYEDIAALRALKGETVTKDGKIRFKDSNKVKYMELRVSPIRDKSSEVIGTVTLGIDIEERLKMEQILKDKENYAM